MAYTVPATKEFVNEVAKAKSVKVSAVFEIDPFAAVEAEVAAAFEYDPFVAVEAEVAAATLKIKIPEAREPIKTLLSPREAAEIPEGPPVKMETLRAWKRYAAIQRRSSTRMLHADLFLRDYSSRDDADYTT